MKTGGSRRELSPSNRAFSLCYHLPMFDAEKHYQVIIEKLDFLIGEVKRMSEDQAQLDTALATLTAAVTQLSTDSTANTAAVSNLTTAVNALIAAIQAGAPDLTNEVNAVQAAMTEVQGTDAAVQASTASLTTSATEANAAVNPAT